MHLIEARELGKDFGAEPLFTGASFSLDPGEKVGVVGPNGSGKTSLLRILCGLDADFRGRLLAKPGLRIGLVPQRWDPPEGLTCREALLLESRAAEAALEAAGEKLGELEGAGLERALEGYAALRARYEELGAEEGPERAGRLLERVGLGGSAEREARLLSGGEKNVLALAAVLMRDPELLVLDEPGNHLDFAGLDWLERFVREERRAVLMVSHNRFLLDRAVDRILEVAGGKVESWTGGYSAYRLERLKRAAGQGKEWQADRKRIERLEALVARFAEIARSRPDPAWGKRLRARRSQLEREKAQAAERPELERGSMRVAFGSAESKADFALIVRDYSKAYGERVLFEKAGFDILAGERVALVGPNGSGKTSFLRDLVAAAGSLDGGPIRVGPSMVLGYCAQGQELLDPARTIEEEFTALGAKGDEAMKLLRSYLFPRSALGKRIGELSGGERNRLQIARAVFLRANFLVLDEPTNHLDIEGREAVEEGLQDFEGSVLLVSHDRWFIEKVAERIVLVEERGFLAYEGSFAEYWRDLGMGRGLRPSSRGRPGEALAGGAIEGRGEALRAARGSGAGGAKAAAGGGAGAGAPGGPAAKGGRGSAAAAARARAAELERRVAALELDKERLEGESQAAIAARDYARGGRLAEEAAKAGRLLDKLYVEWEAAAREAG